MITLIGFARVRGRYGADALQVCNRRGRGGPYGYRGGWNVRASVAWAAGSGIGLLSVGTPAYSGPLLPVTGGIDLSFLISGAVTAAVYLALDAGRPHPVPPARTPERIAVPVWDGPLPARPRRRAAGVRRRPGPAPGGAVRGRRAVSRPGGASSRGCRGTDRSGCRAAPCAASW
ncbi:cytosine permease [Actinacidiphila glaucinigra]|uniref:cytosine permease n=1 Tax=Actinacidiphila glaucinigra TaxID=235986 RepID=UPI003F4BE833